MKRKKVNWARIIIWTSIYLMLFFGGIIVGMGIQQRIFFIGLGEALSYTNIEINFNETKLVEEMNKTFIPNFKAVMNDTLSQMEKGAKEE